MMANGRVIYPSGAVTQVIYDFPHNYDPSDEIGYLDTDDNARALDGTLNSIAGAQKKTFDLIFTNAPKSQGDYFVSLWRLQCPVDLYLDGVNLDATVKIMGTPRPKTAPYWSNGEQACSFDIKSLSVINLTFIK
jgi:hypothetical protein